MREGDSAPLFSMNQCFDNSLNMMKNALEKGEDIASFEDLTVRCIKRSTLTIAPYLASSVYKKLLKERPELSKIKSLSSEPAINNLKKIE